MEKIQSFLLDTNILIDYAVVGRAGHRDAVSLVDEAIRKSVTLLYAATSIKDVFFLLAKELKRDAREAGSLKQGDSRAIRAIAWSVVDAIRENATAVGVDESDVWLACKYRELHDDLEDNLVLAAAERSKASFLVTNDEALIKHAPVPVLSAEDALVHLRFLRGGAR